MACAEGTITQDPGRVAPGNLTFQNLGPAGPVPGPTESRRPTAEWHGAGINSASSPLIGRVTSSTGFGSGNTFGFGR